MQNVLVLCIGNICRSPMPEGLLRQALPGKTIRLAGLSALIGKPAHPYSVQIMAEHGIGISAHRAQGISSRLVSKADLILVMDLEQKNMWNQTTSAAKERYSGLANLPRPTLPTHIARAWKASRLPIVLSMKV